MNSLRYLADFDTKSIQNEKYDVVIIGSGIAGIYTALEIGEKYNILVITKESMDMSNSVLAQGGIAVSLDESDSPELHFKDTLYAGAGLCDEDSVWVLVNEAVENIKSLCQYGVNFDRKNDYELSLTREGAHSKNRIIHAGDTTGKEVLDKLLEAAKNRKNIRINEKIFALDIITYENECKGVLTFDEKCGDYKIYLTNTVVCATGGFGQLYEYTTNPEVATGDGVCMAYRAGAELMDLEFIQFHPTVLFHPENKSFLISEAVRGEGALLRNVHGKRFMPDYHELEELAPRDVVSRAIFEEMKKTNSTNVFLDITFKSKEYFENRFPNIYKTCLGYGIDISKDYIPVAPAEHYCMGGIRSDIFGRTNIKGLYSCGEAACNGIHGANRLASNSLLEGLVFGHKIGIEIDEFIKSNELAIENIELKISLCKDKIDVDVSKIIFEIRQLMTDNVGIIRDKVKLLEAKEKIEEYSLYFEDKKCTTIKDFELINILTLARLVIDSSLKREESRGAHFRLDFAFKDDLQWNKHIIIKRSEE